MNTINTIFKSIFNPQKKTILNKLNKMSANSSISNPYRELNSTENFHTNIYDFRKFLNENLEKKTPNNKILVTCEHATNNFHSFENNLSNEDKKFLETHWGYDIGAKNLALNISEQIESLLICTNFSRLLIDPNRGVLSNTLIRKLVEVDYELQINKNCSREERINMFYLPYYNILYEVLNSLYPKYFLSIHSFTPFYEKDAKRDFHVGVLFKKENDLSRAILKRFDEHKVDYRINEPYNMNDGELFAFDAITNYNFPEICQGLLLEIRNDVAEDEKYKSFISGVISQGVKDLKLN